MPPGNLRNGEAEMKTTRRQKVPPPPIGEFIANPGLVLVEFWTRWSGGSFLVGVAVDEFLRDRQSLSIRVGRIDADRHPEICAQFRAQPPMLLLFLDGTAIARHSGLISRPALSDWLDRAIRNAPSTTHFHTTERTEP